MRGASTVENRLQISIAELRALSELDSPLVPEHVDIFYRHSALPLVIGDDNSRIRNAHSEAGHAIIHAVDGRDDIDWRTPLGDFIGALNELAHPKNL